MGVDDNRFAQNNVNKQFPNNVNGVFKYYLVGCKYLFVAGIHSPTVVIPFAVYKLTIFTFKRPFILYKLCHLYEANPNETGTNIHVT